MRVGDGEVGVADPAGDEGERELGHLHLHTRAQSQALGLRALAEHAADRVVVGRLGVVEDQRGGCELLDGGGTARAPGVGADVEQLVADERADVEPVVVDREEHDAGLELAAPHALGDR